MQVGRWAAKPKSHSEVEWVEPPCGNWSAGCKCTGRWPGYFFCCHACGKGEVCQDDYHPSKKVQKQRDEDRAAESSSLPGMPPAKSHSSAKPNAIWHKGKVLYKTSTGEMHSIMQDERDEVQFKKLLKRVHLQLVKYYTKLQGYHRQGRHINLYRHRRNGETSRPRTTALEMDCLEYSKLRNDNLSCIGFILFNTVQKVVDNTAILMALDVQGKALAYLQGPRMQLDTLHRIQRMAYEVAVQIEEHGLRRIDSPTHMAVSSQIDLCSKCIADALPDCDIVNTFLQTFTDGYPYLC
jgi:hypothetical protein